MPRRSAETLLWMIAARMSSAVPFVRVRPGDPRDTPGMDLRRRVMSGMARQLGEPQGWRGRLVGRGLNRGNRDMVRAAVHAADVHAGDSVADLGFGGGLGLGLPPDALGAGGAVHGPEVPATLDRAARRRDPR